MYFFFGGAPGGGAERGVRVALPPAGGGTTSPGSGTSWFAQSVQLNVSPTYAEPNDGGSCSIGASRNGSGFESAVVWYAREAGVGASLLSFWADGDKGDDADGGEARGGGRGCWTTREGRESLLYN